jgi:hypothetical protein
MMLSRLLVDDLSSYWYDDGNRLGNKGYLR